MEVSWAHAVWSAPKTVGQRTTLNQAANVDPGLINLADSYGGVEDATMATMTHVWLGHRFLPATDGHGCRQKVDGTIPFTSHIIWGIVPPNSNHIHAEAGGPRIVEQARSFFSLFT